LIGGEFMKNLNRKIEKQITKNNEDPKNKKIKE
jgi:hypothetical protein